MIPSEQRFFGLSLRKQRLRLTWVLAPFFFPLAKPSPSLLLLGALLSVPGLVLRALAAGTIHKDRSLAVTGPYAHLRHPLYLGSFILGLALVVAGGRWGFLPLFLGVFLWAYGRTVLVEDRGLELRFGEPYRDYRAEVPSFFPRVRPYAPTGSEKTVRGQGGALPFGFRPWLYRRNREWATSAGLLIAFSLLWMKVVFFG